MKSDDITTTRRKGPKKVRPATPPTVPRDNETFLWRGSTELRNWISHAASEKDVSRNAVMTAALLVASMLDEVPKLGPPRNVLQLLEEIELALESDSLVWGHLHVEDWEHAQGCVETFVKTGLITPPQTKTDGRVPDAVAYTFRTTKLGRDVLPTAIKMLRPFFQAMAGEKEATMA
jgi:hypothetical protein